ncbi:hypothetical protein GGX14DRAFT_612676 [Mycena pura]|uniref:Phosphatidate phosphatase APP1 catalytic domain-containing protein n=1 Tax=Mycena pura TaxID=153505 RepID=A0AAD6YSN1_9AGAR|nr:hypothetical protein GGX14DRAFT_612676 [Mycena pura]
MIDRIHGMYPNKKFLAVGDSTQQDPETYGEAIRKYGDFIACAWIRKVDDANNTDARFQAAFQGVAPAKFKIYTDDEILSLANIDAFLYRAPMKQPLPPAVQKFIDFNNQVQLPGVPRQWNNVPDDVDAFIATHIGLPDTLRNKCFDNQVRISGSYDAAVAVFRRHADGVASGVMVDAAFPPHNAVVQSFPLGDLTIFYHSLYPADLPGKHDLMWNFYIGTGPSQDSIMPDWAERNIKLYALGFFGKWEQVFSCTVVPSAHIRISYLDKQGRKCTQEIFFPAEPSNDHVFQSHVLPAPPTMNRGGR